MKTSIGITAVLIILSVLFSTFTEASTAQQDFSQGFELIRAGKPKEATAKFEHGLKTEPNNALAHFYLAEAYFGQKQNDMSKAHNQKSLEIDPSGPVAQDAKYRLEQLSGSAKGLAVGSEFQDCGVCPVMVVIPAGQFIMGSPPYEIGRFDEEGPAHLVRLTHSFAVGKFEVTFDEWNACVTNRACAPAHDEGWGQGRLPVINVNYDQAVGYVNWLAKKSAKKYRLLSEAEWEYAARTGSNEANYWRNAPDLACQFENVRYQSSKRSDGNQYGTFDYYSCDDGYANNSPVGSFKPNAFGLYDMMGNVSKIVEDCFNEKGYVGAPTDVSAWVTCDCPKRVDRGCSAHNTSFAHNRFAFRRPSSNSKA